VIKITSACDAYPRLLFTEWRRIRLRRVHDDLNEIGETCGKNRLGRIMQLNRIKAMRGYKAPRCIAGRPSVVAPNRVQRQFAVVRASQVWVTDISYIRTWQGWLYLAVVIDLFARNVVGWSMKPTLSRELALDALLIAVWRHKPDDEVSCTQTRAASTTVATGGGSVGPITWPPV